MIIGERNPNMVSINLPKEEALSSIPKRRMPVPIKVKRKDDIKIAHRALCPYMVKKLITSCPDAKPAPTTVPT